MWKMSRDHNFALQLSKSSNDSIHNRHFSDVLKVVEEGKKRKEEQFLNQIEQFKTKKSQNEGSIDFIKGTAKFTSPNEISVSSGEKITTISSQNFVIATGSSPREPQDPKVDGFRILTSDQILNLQHFPKSILIVGAG